MNVFLSNPRYDCLVSYQFEALESLHELAVLVLEPVCLVYDSTPPHDLAQVLHVSNDNLIRRHQRMELIDVGNAHTLKYTYNSIEELNKRLIHQI